MGGRFSAGLLFLLLFPGLVVDPVHSWRLPEVSATLQSAGAALNARFASSKPTFASGNARDDQRVACNTASLSADHQVTYNATWESLDQRPVPDWFTDAKFGIFIHWGLYSVPAWSPAGNYAEWYWHALNDGPTSPVAQFHRRAYGPHFRYADFAPMFRTELFEPAQWAALFEAAGARYVVLTSKHHEGYTLWDSPQSWNWNSVDTGPHRQLLQEVSAAVRAEGLRFGTYYSLLEWYHPLFENETDAYVQQHMLPQMRDLVRRVQPDIFWGDGDWVRDSRVWRTPEFMAWLFNESPVRDKVVINDRWGSDVRGRHGGFFTPEFSAQVYRGHAWEENSGVDRFSFGYNRDSKAQDYLPVDYLVRLLVRCVANGGNLLLDVGPSSDGRIPELEQERLLGIGAWLKTNGEAIYNSTTWRTPSEDEAAVRLSYSHRSLRAGTANFANAAEPDGDGATERVLLSAVGPVSGAGSAAVGMDFARVYYTAQKPAAAEGGAGKAGVGGVVYATLLKYPEASACNDSGRPYAAVNLTAVSPTTGTRVQLLGYNPPSEDQTGSGSTLGRAGQSMGALRWEVSGDDEKGMRIYLPALGSSGMDAVQAWAAVLEITAVH